MQTLTVETRGKASYQGNRSSYKRCTLQAAAGRTVGHLARAGEGGQERLLGLKGQDPPHPTPSRVTMKGWSRTGCCQFLTAQLLLFRTKSSPEPTRTRAQTQLPAGPARASRARPHVRSAATASLPLLRAVK